jgi:hypothetical protein
MGTSPTRRHQDARLEQDEVWLSLSLVPEEAGTQ